MHEVVGNATAENRFVLPRIARSWSALLEKVIVPAELERATS